MKTNPDCSSCHYLAVREDVLYCSFTADLLDNARKGRKGCRKIGRYFKLAEEIKTL